MKKITFSKWIISIAAYLGLMYLGSIIFKQRLVVYVKYPESITKDYVIENILFIALAVISTYNIYNYTKRYFKRKKARKT